MKWWKGERVIYEPIFANSTSSSSTNGSNGTGNGGPLIDPLTGESPIIGYVAVSVPVLRMWLSRRQPYSTIRSARRVHDALTYPKTEIRLGISE